MITAKRRRLRGLADNDQERVVTVPTEDGRFLTLSATELKAARVRTVWNSQERMLQVVIVWHDNGLPGHPQIEDHGDDVSVTIRPSTEPESVLDRANAQRRQLCGPMAVNP